MDTQNFDLVERFIAAYNTIDAHLQRVLGAQSHSSFRSLVDLYAKRHRWWQDAEPLRVFANLRNVLVHEKMEAYDYICVPSSSAVQRIEAIRDRLVDPETALPRFAREVRTVRPETTVAHALRIIREIDASQLPVYQSNAQKGGYRRFRGVLTENNLTRWLAAQAHNGATHGDSGEANDRPLHLDLEKFTVSDILQHGGKRPNFEFVAPHTSVEEIAYLFHENTFLEVVLVSADGSADAALQGVVSRGDVWRFESGN